MASHGNPNFPPSFNPNFPPNNYIRNSGMDRHPGPQLQKPFNVPFRSLQPSQSFMHGFQNRPPFSNFPESMNASDFLNRPPPPPLPSPSLPPNAGSFHPPSSHNMPSLSHSPHQPPLHHAPPIQHPLPPAHHTNPFQQPPPSVNHAPSVSQPPPHSHFSLPPQPVAPSHSYPRPPFSHPPVSHHSQPCLPPPSHHPRPHLHPVTPPGPAFHMKSPPPVPRPRFNSSMHRPFQRWNQVPRFSNPRPPFHNQARMPVPSSQFKDESLRTDKKKKQRSRDTKKLKSWMTDELFAEVKKKNALYLKAKSSDEQTAWQEFRLQRNRVSSLTKEAKIKAGLISRKVKEDTTTEKPFSCDTCDRAFVAEKELEDHFSQHIKCNHENCMFEAHPKIVELHKKMQHDTGYADRISRLKDAAEIKKWREERRRRFPTAENIRKRKAEQAEREARGEVLETKEFGKFKRKREENGNGNVANNQRKRSKRRSARKYQDGRTFQRHPCSQPFKVYSESDSDSDSHITLNEFLGLSSLTNCVTEESGQNNYVEAFSTPFIKIDAGSEKHQLTSQSSLKHNLPKFNAVNANHSNVSYSENNSVNRNIDTPFHLNAEKINVNTTCADQSVCEIPEDEIEKPQSELVVIEDSDDEGPEVIAMYRERAKVNGHCTNDGALKTLSSISEVPKISEVEDKEDTRNDKKLGNTFTGKKVNKIPDKRHVADEVRKSTLLEKLLADDIRHERNVILQCIRHIVNNNFFGIASKKS